MEDLLFRLLCDYKISPPVELVRGVEPIQYSLHDTMEKVLPLYSDSIDDASQMAVVELAVIGTTSCMGKGKGHGYWEDGKGEDEDEQQSLVNKWFHKAVAKGHLSVVQAVLEAGVNINKHLWEISRKEACNTFNIATPALYKAVQLGDLKIINLLIQNHACVNSSDTWTGTYRTDIHQVSILHCAVTGGHLEVCRLLLEATADPMSAKKKTLACGPDKGKGRKSALFSAASGGSAEICSLLLEFRANPGDGCSDEDSSDYGKSYEVFRQSPLEIAKGQKCKDVLTAAAADWCCNPEWRGWRCYTCGAQN